MASPPKSDHVAVRLVDRVSPLVPRAAKQALGRRWHRWRMAYINRFHAFGRGDLSDRLRSLGVGTGDVIFVHSSFDRFEGFTGGPFEVIGALQDAVGVEGTILMPTMPFTGSALDYVATGQTLDVTTTPSRMGLVTELFRRSPGVSRSVHPTHPVAVWGARARELIEGHHAAATPCGRESPFGRILEHDGKIVLLGTTMRSLSFFHTIEEIIEDQLPLTPFTEETFTLEARDADGSVLTSRTRLWTKEVMRRRNPFKLVPALQKSGQWAEARVGRLSVTVLEARHVLDAARSLAAAGVFCYD